MSAKAKTKAARLAALERLLVERLGVRLEDFDSAKTIAARDAAKRKGVAGIEASEVQKILGRPAAGGKR